MTKHSLLFVLLHFLVIVLSGSQVAFGNDKLLQMKARHDCMAVILVNPVSESEAQRALGGYFGSADKITSIGIRTYLVEFSSVKSETEIEGIGNLISARESNVKYAVKAFHGTSRKVIQIPSDRLIVKLKQGVEKERLDFLNSRYGCTVIGNVNGSRGFLLQTDTYNRTNTMELSAAYSGEGIFEYVQPDFFYPGGKLLQSIPNDPYFAQQWALHNTGQLIQTGSPFAAYGDASSVNGIPDADMDLPEAWDITTGSPSIKIAVIDSGIDSAHAEFQSPGHLLPGYDAFNNAEGSAVDYFNHGTSVAGIVGAVSDNGTGVAGIAPDCKLMSVCIFDANGTTSTSIITRAFDTAVARGTDIITNSWGGGQPEPAITDAINNAAVNGRNGLGCVVIFASGNDGINPPIYPSVLPNVVSVGGSTPHDQVKTLGTGNQFYWGSNYGENEIGDLDVIAPTNCYAIASGGGYDAYFWGTSATAPQAAGVAALVLSVNPSQSRLDVFSNLMRGCDKPDNVPYSVTKTYGKWNHNYGYGRINAYNSVMLASGIDVVGPTINHENVAAHSSTYATVINAEILDQNGGAVPATGSLAPMVHFRTKKSTGPWSAYDSVQAHQNSGNTFYFRISSLGWDSEVQYYITAFDNLGNFSEFPRYAPAGANTCYFAVGNIVSESSKIGAFTGADYGATLSPPASLGSYKIVDAKVKISMRHTYLAQESIILFTPLADANYNRKCLFAGNGGSGDNVYNATVTDSASMFWRDGQPPFLNGTFKPEYTLRGLRGNSSAGLWKVIHFDNSITDYAFFDSVRITIYRTNGTKSPCARLNSPADSVLNFGAAAFPGTYEKNFYLKNSGTSALNISSYNFSGQRAAMYSLLNTPPASVAAGDSALFRVRLNSTVGSSAFSQAVLNVGTNDPSKPVFKVSMVTDDSLMTGLKNLQLTALIEGFYNPVADLQISDTVKVILRNFTPPYARIDSAKGVLSSSGTGSFNFANAQSGVNYYAVVVHRNSVETWSSAPVVFSGIQASYNFTNSASSAFGSNLRLVGSKYCIHSGDILWDGSVDGTDVLLADNAAAEYATGYVPEDVNGDGIVDGTDFGITHNNAEEYVQLIRP